jgi:hypothetical protein
MDPNYIKLKNGKEVLESNYITAKTKDLIKFGYIYLEEATVRTQLNRIKAGDDLSVIGMLMTDDLFLENERKEEL